MRIVLQATLPLMSVSLGKMRLGASAVNFAARVPQNENKVPFIPGKLPMALRGRISGKGQTQKEVACLQPMLDMIACLKEHEYDQKPCSALKDTFDTCWKNYLAKHRVYKENLAKGNVGPLPKQKRDTIEFQQLNVYLKKFPPMP